MIETFLRRPRGAGEVAADVVRLLGIASIIAVAIGWALSDVGIFILVLGGLVLARSLGLRPALDIAFCLSLLVAAWSAVTDLYTTIAWWDLVVHFFAVGAIGAVIYVLLTRTRMLRQPLGERSEWFTTAVVVTAFGLAIGAVWEMVEWAGKTFIDDTIFVGYRDSIGDLAIDALGAIVAGCSMRWLAPPTRTRSSKS